MKITYGSSHRQRNALSINSDLDNAQDNTPTINQTFNGIPEETNKTPLFPKVIPGALGDSNLSTISPGHSYCQNVTTRRSIYILSSRRTALNTHLCHKQ